MALLLIEGFDDSVASGGTGVPITASSGVTTFNTTYARWAGGMGVTNNANATTFAVNATPSPLIAGIAARPTSLGNGGSAFGYILGFGNADGLHLMLCTNTQGGIDLRLGNGGTAAVVYSTPQTWIVPINVYSYFEMKATCADAGGNVIVRINGTQVLNYTGDTRTTGTLSYFDRVYIGGASFILLDDLYIADTTGSAPTNDFLGDVRVQTILPSGNGNSSQGTGSDTDSTDNYALVDEGPATSGTDYVDLTATEKDTYTYQDATAFASNASIYGVQVTSTAAKTDTGAVNAAAVSRLGGTESTSTTFTPSTTTATYPRVFETKPGGGTWTTQDVNDAEFGIIAS